MPKKIGQKTYPRTRTSAKQILAAYKNSALTYIQNLRNPKTQFAFSVKAYEIVNGVKKPNAASAPELLAFVGTAAKLSKEVRLTASGEAVHFSFVDAPSDIPNELF